MITKKRVLIVGGGVAGISLSHHLLSDGHQVVLLDDGKNVSSVIATGMVNPMSFRRTLLSWNATQFVQYAKSFYLELESLTGQKFLNELTIRRLFSSDEERLIWDRRSEEMEFTPFIESLSKSDLTFKFATLGSGRVKQSFWVDAPAFMSAMHKLLKQKGVLKTQTFTYGDFDPVSTTYKGDVYDVVVFANGYRNFENPYFKDVSVQTAKGQEIKVRWPAYSGKESLHRKCFMLPIGSNVFRVGATYEWDQMDTQITEEAKQDLLLKIKSITDDEVEVLHQHAGIRPTSPDRRPLVGQHKEFKNLYLFNGLGTKGYLIAPSLADNFTRHLSEGTDLMNETRLYRFKNK